VIIITAKIIANNVLRK